MGDDRVSALAQRLIHDEVAPTLVAEYPDLAEVVAQFADVFLERCKRSFKDPCARVGRDPMRKLQRNERIFSSIDLANKHGIATPALAQGAALAIHYALRCNSAKDREAQRMKQLYNASGERVDAVLTHDGDYHGKPYPGLHPVEDASIIDSIADSFHRLQQRDSAQWAAAPAASVAKRSASNHQQP
jgi:mannitol-1-phosphate/altronate dehydrogenase